jgi:uncharacterized protein YodC (DUF2158 family)
MSETFKDGDVVVLKSGGPKMSIAAFPNNVKGNLIRCTWFDQQEALKSDLFAPDTLMKA